MRLGPEISGTPRQQVRLLEQLKRLRKAEADVEVAQLAVCCADLWNAFDDKAAHEQELALIEKRLTNIRKAITKQKSYFTEADLRDYNAERKAAERERKAAELEQAKTRKQQFQEELRVRPITQEERDTDWLS